MIAHEMGLQARQVRKRLVAVRAGAKRREGRATSLATRNIPVLLSGAMPNHLLFRGETQVTDEATVLDLAGRHCPAGEDVVREGGTRWGFVVAMVAAEHSAAMLVHTPRGNRMLRCKVVVQLCPVAEV